MNKTRNDNRHDWLMVFCRKMSRHLGIFRTRTGRRHKKSHMRTWISHWRSIGRWT